MFLLSLPLTVASAAFWHSRSFTQSSVQLQSYHDSSVLKDMDIACASSDYVRNMKFNLHSETSFHIFIAMASRRLEADRFFTKDFKPEVRGTAILTLGAAH